MFCDLFWGATELEQAGVLIGLAARLIPLDVRAVGVAAARLLVLTAPMETSTNVDNYVSYVLKMKDPLHPNQHPPNDPPPSFDSPTHPPPPYSGRQEGL